MLPTLINTEHVKFAELFGVFIIDSISAGTRIDNLL